jgi:predicted outer membrane repeat protein
MRFYIPVFLIFFFYQTSLATRYYVSPEGTGTGTSWAESSADLATILKNSEFGDEVWVAIGTYYPTRDNDRKAFFELKDGVSLRGGFMGYEKLSSDRDPANGRSILSGSIGESGKQDNSFTVLYSENVSESTLIEGFIISDGNADFDAHSQASPLTCGAGWYNKFDGENGTGWPIVRDVYFMNNTALYGAAVYGEIQNYSEFSALFNNCSFDNNEAYYFGGAFYMDGDFNDMGHIEFKDCTFTNNTALNGGGLSIITKSEKPNIKILSCIFTANCAILNGGAIYCPVRLESNNEIVYEDSKFNENCPRNIN